MAWNFDSPLKTVDSGRRRELEFRSFAVIPLLAEGGGMGWVVQPLIKMAAKISLIFKRFISLLYKASG